MTTPLDGPRSTDDTIDVVIVGAGVSGLRAATSLARADVAVRVFEARDRVGGRLRSIDSPDGGADAPRIDLGATWFWPNEPRVNALVTELGLEAFPQHLAGDMVFQSGATQRAPNQLDVPSGRLVRGLQAIPEALFAGLDPQIVQLGQAVSAIGVAEDGQLAVTTSDGRWNARHVVVALPPALAVASVDFGEGLPPEIVTLAATTPVWMGSTVKIVALYDRPFWREEGLAGSAFSHDGPIREIHDMSGPDGSPAALFGFCATGPADPAPTEGEVLEQLSTLFGPDASTAVALHIIDWRTESHTTPIEAIGMTSYDTYGHPLYRQPALGGRLHWCSTETATEAPGHVEGALAAADRTTDTIIAALSSARTHDQETP